RATDSGQGGGGGTRRWAASRILAAGGMSRPDEQLDGTNAEILLGILAGSKAPRAYLVLIAALTLLATSAGTVAIPWSFLACSAAFFMTSASSRPSKTAAQPGTTSPHLRIFDMSYLPVLHSGSKPERDVEDS